MNQDETLEEILAVIERVQGDADLFAETLRQQRIPHLSFSQITTVEFCRYRYYLQYIRLIDPQPLPDYFNKGKLLHQLIARTYQHLDANRPIDLRDHFEEIGRYYHDERQTHLENAVLVHLQNLWADCQIVAIEKPFAMIIDELLPPCVGVIDLILRQGNQYIIVDHKTGRDFYPQDELQMAIYAEFIRREYAAGYCKFYYDQYRWVNNLQRIRKPAFHRTAITPTSSDWSTSLHRIREAYKTIQHIYETKRAERFGECFRCPYRQQC